MPFQSFSFVAFVLLAAGAYAFAVAAARPYVLLCASVIFFVTWSVWHTALLLGLTTLVYFLAFQVERCASDAARSRWALSGTAVVLGVLCVFKYLPAVSGLRLIAPLGISYYCFKLVSYLLDVSWGRLGAERSFVHFANSIAFFPQAVCGPIQRPIEALPMLRRAAPPSADMAASGLRRILFGVFQKFVVAERLGLLVDPVFNDPRAHTGFQLLFATILFPFQLYADFAGLTDIANGVARLFGIVAPENFNDPFYARNIQEFWRRWHISLTTWLTQYLFIPLNHALRRLGLVGAILAVSANMITIAVWHGARASYLVFGLINAAYMSVSIVTLKRRIKAYRSNPMLAAWQRWLAPLLTFSLIAFALIFFRAGSANDGFYIGQQSARTVLAIARRLGTPLALKAILASPWATRELRTDMALGVVGVFAMEAVRALRSKHGGRFLALPTALRWTAYYAMIFATILGGVFTTRQFIYAQF